MSRSMIPILVATLAGCATMPFSNAPNRNVAERLPFEIGSVRSIEPAPAPRPQDWSSFKIVPIGGGSPQKVEIAPFGTSGVRGRFADGCVWTRQADWFSPSDSWAFCGRSDVWRTAQATVRRSGSLWPLRIGATAAYVREARSSTTGEVSRRTTNCKVIDTVGVRRFSGERESAFKVRCDDGRRVRTSWWSPDIGLLFFRQTHRSRGVERFWERVD